MKNRIVLSVEEKRRFIQWCTQKIKDKLNEPLDEKDYTEKAGRIIIASSYKFVADNIGNDK